MLSAVDLLIVNDVMLPLIHKLHIEDHPPRANSKNFHAHLALQLNTKPLQPEPMQQ